MILNSNSGSSEFATIEVKDTGEVIAATKKGTTHHWLSHNDDENLIPENIKSGVSIFGVDGSLSSGGFYQSTITLSGETQFHISGIGDSFTPKGFYIVYGKQIHTNPSDDASEYEARSIFYHKDMLINNENIYLYSYLKTSNSYYYMKSDPIADCDYVEIIFNEDNSIYIGLQVTDHAFYGEYYIYVF